MFVERLLIWSKTRLCQYCWVAVARVLVRSDEISGGLLISHLLQPLPFRKMERNVGFVTVVGTTSNDEDATTCGHLLMRTIRCNS